MRLSSLRHSATSALFERRDVIIVASGFVYLFSFGDPIDYQKHGDFPAPRYEKATGMN